MLAEEVSSDSIALDFSKDDKTRSAQKPINMDIINELELNVNTTNNEDLQQINYLLQEILEYPIAEKAQIHCNALKLGNFDLEKAQNNAKARLDTTNELMEEQKPQFCECCGFVKQQDNIKMCTSIDLIKNMGLSTYLFFSIFKNLSILLLIMTIVYSAFSLATNVVAASSLTSSEGINLSSLDYIAISLSSKQTNPTDTNKRYYFISCWLGLAMILFWIMALVGIKYKQAQNSQEYDEDTISCSDYSIVVEGLPVDVRQEQLQTQFNRYFDATIKNNQKIPTVWKQPLNIAKINVGKPFYMAESSLTDEELQKINEELEEIKGEFVEWIKSRQSEPSFSRSKQQRKGVYQNYSRLSKRKIEKILELSTKLKTALKNESNQELTTVFITFQQNNAKTVIDHIHQTGLVGRIRALCSDEFKRFTFTRGDNEFKLEIMRAPEPEDIIWENIGHKDCAIYCRKLLTYTVTALLLGASFGIVFGLSKAQQSANQNRLLSIAISVTISVVNILLVMIIKFLTYYQKDYTATYREGSLAVKSIIAQMINTIIIPVVTAYEIKNNVYATSGLVDNIFMLGISTALLPPVILFIDPYNLFMKVVRCIKSRPSSKLSQTQKEHNYLHEGIQFQLGYHYIYVANVFLFVCFFVSLQPIVSVFALVGYFLMYWVHKYCMFNRYRRPVPSTDFVSNAVYRMLMLGPLCYSLGSLTWSNLSPDGIPREALLPNLICVGISVVLIFVPLHTIILKACFEDQYQKIKKYENQRILFPSQYDRLNPSTQDQGILQYKKYMEKKVEELKGCSKEEQTLLAQLINKNAQRSHQINQGNMSHQMGGAFGGAFGSLFKGAGQPAYAPPQMSHVQQPMQGIFPGLFPAMQPQQRHPQQNPMTAFMMAPVAPQPVVHQPPIHQPVAHQPPRNQPVPHQPVVHPPPQVPPPRNPYPSLQMIPQPVNAPPAFGMIPPNSQPQQNPLNMMGFGNPNAMSGNPNPGQQNNSRSGNNYRRR